MVNAKHKIKKIKDPQERKLVQERFDEYLNNEFLDKHNQELGNRILDYFDNHKDLRVRRIMNTPTKRGSIESLHNLKVNKKIYNMYGTLKHSTPINSQTNKREKINTSKDKVLLKKNSKKVLSQNDVLNKLLKNLDKNQFKKYIDLKLKLKKLRRKIKNTYDVEKIEKYRKDIIKLNNQIDEYHALAFKGQQDSEKYQVSAWKDFLEDSVIILPKLLRKVSKTREEIQTASRTLA